MRTFPFVIGVVLTIVSGLLVIGPVAAQDDDQDPFLDYLLIWGGAPTEPATADPAVLDRLAVASFLAESDIDREDYVLAGVIGRRLEQEGLTTDELSSLYVTDIETRLTYRMLGIVAVVNLLLVAVWRWFTVRAEGKS